MIDYELDSNSLIFKKKHQNNVDLDHKDHKNDDRKSVQVLLTKEFAIE
jgi:hypothetical protein